jgi:hypothetical protein
VQWMIQNTDDVVGGVKKKKEKKTIKNPFITHEEQSLITHWHLTWTRSKFGTRFDVTCATRTRGRNKRMVNSRGSVEYTSLSRYVFSFTICSISFILSHLVSLHNHSPFTVTRIFVQVSTSYTS